MRIAGILCEYNPFHIGHEKQIQAVKRKTDVLICLMSGSFVQRGEPAMFDKFVRARWALTAGADAVFELPCMASLSSAEGFAMGGMRLFDKMGIDTLYFGSECGLDNIRRLADVLYKPSPSFDHAFHRHLAAGISYAAARERAAREADVDLPDSVFMRNAMLGTEYILALIKLNSHIDPVALPRFGDVSASRVRRSLSRLNGADAIPDTLMHLLPAHVLADIPSLHPVTEKVLSSMLLYRLRTMQKQEYAGLPNISEGLDNRLYHAARQARDYEELLRLAAHKRMPLSRIRRTLMYALLHIDQPAYDRYARHMPQYLRLVGMREDTAAVLSHIKQTSGLPIVTQPAHCPDDILLPYDVRATDIHALLSGYPAGLDYTTRLITL